MKDEIEVPIDTETPRAVSAIVRRGDRYLLVLRANPPAQNRYAFPGGRIDPGETAEEAVLRELEEETGIAATAHRPYATYDLTNFATLRVWSVQITVVDIVYGAAASAVTAVLAFLATRAVSGWLAGAS